MVSFPSKLAGEPLNASNTAITMLTGNKMRVIDKVKISKKLPSLSVTLSRIALKTTTNAAIPVAAETNCKKVITANCVKYVNPDSPE